MACGDGLSGSATGRNVADMEHLEDQLSIFSTNMATFNEENNNLAALLEQFEARTVNPKSGQDK